MKNKKPLASFVVPMLNEKACVNKFYLRLIRVCKIADINYEIICINDGSTDQTLSELKKLRAKNPKVKIISLARNFGHQVAVMAGLKYTSGIFVVVMDADLQDPPEIVPNMINKWRQGYKVVYGIRKDRQESWPKTFCYKAFYRLLQKVSLMKNIPLDAGDFCLMDAQVVREIRRLEESKPFVRGLRSWVGFKQTGIKYTRPARLAGKSKYNYLKLLHLASDGLLSFSTLALKMATVTGFLISLISILYALYMVANRILIIIGVESSENLIPGWTTLVSGLTLLIGLLFIYLGIIGEYVGRIYMEIKKRPLFIIEEMLGLRNEKA